MVDVLIKAYIAAVLCESLDMVDCPEATACREFAKSRPEVREQLEAASGDPSVEDTFREAARKACRDALEALQRAVAV
jgi:hypothetical protein